MPKFVFKVSIFLVFCFLATSVFGASLEAPKLLRPTSANSPLYAGEIEFRWEDTGAAYYQYHINISGGVAEGEIIQPNSVKIYSLAPGNYSWSVRSCSDSKAESCGSYQTTESFKIVSAPSELLGGLIPCGRQYDNPDTAYINESKPCQLGDLFLLIKLVLDFLLWKLGLMVLVILSAVTGVVFYFSFGGPETVNKAKSILKSALTGYAIIFLAWLIVNLLLKFLGYQHLWWEISF